MGCGRAGIKRHGLTKEFFRLGVLSMILCFALGIANLFIADLIIIIISALCV